MLLQEMLFYYAFKMMLFKVNFKEFYVFGIKNYTLQLYSMDTKEFLGLMTVYFTDSNHRIQMHVCTES